MIAGVRLWGRTIGAIAHGPQDVAPTFEYDAEFAKSGIEVAPVMMPLSRKPYQFPDLLRTSFDGLPGLVADSLPDKFGSTLINAWLASQGRSPASFTPIERLCYIGNRGMGALEFFPTTGPEATVSNTLEIAQMVELASTILQQRETFTSTMDAGNSHDAMTDILRIGTSAGGARAKALIAWNKQTNEVCSGQVKAGTGFSYWLLKFDGVGDNVDKELALPLGFGAVEFAYSNMAQAAGIEMTECSLLEEHGRRHFITRRFDRTEDGNKLHMQSLASMAHYDFNLAGAYSYEQAFVVLRQLGLSTQQREQLFRRMVFNVVARNQDDHVKNISFLMDREGVWWLAPAYDVTYSFNPEGRWTSQHQMTINNKRDNFDVSDLVACAKSAVIQQGKAETILKDVTDVVASWSTFANDAGVDAQVRDNIKKTHRLDIR